MTLLQACHIGSLAILALLLYLVIRWMENPRAEHPLVDWKEEEASGSGGPGGRYSLPDAE